MSGSSEPSRVISSGSPSSDCRVLFFVSIASSALRFSFPCVASASVLKFSQHSTIDRSPAERDFPSKSYKAPHGSVWSSGRLL